MTSQTGKRPVRAGSLLAVMLAAGCRGGVEYTQTTFHPVSEFGASLNRVFFNTFWWTMAILAVVLVLMVIAVVRFRERPGRPHPKQTHGNTLLEMVWTLIPAVIVVFIGVPTVQTVFSSQRPPSPEALEIEVIGHQWWWEFRYPAEGVVTANQFYIPTNREVHLRMRSADVVHSFWIPRIGGKRDVMPSPRTAEGERPRPNHLVFTVTEAGRYRGQCAEFCGEAHGLMVMHAVAAEPLEFEQWLASMRTEPAAPAAAQDTAPPATLEARGRQIFLSRSCIACHAVANTTAMGVVGPSLTRFGSRPTVGAGARPNTLENVAAWIRDPQTLKAGTLMPGARTAAGGFPPTGLTDDEIDAVAAWLISLR